MRRFIRHPSEIPVVIEPWASEHRPEPIDSHLRDVGLGGVSFLVSTTPGIGTLVRVCIPLVAPPFEALGRVTHVEREDAGNLVGVSFPDREAAYRARMVEQVCHIEQYRRQVWSREGRMLSVEAAAREWIERYAASFPRLDEIA